MDLTVTAVVLKRVDAGENDRRLTLLTRELGKIDVVAKGARKGASRLAGASDPLSASILTFASGRKTRFVIQAQPLTSFRGLRGDFDRLSYALALVELYAGVIPWEEELPDAFDLLLLSLRHLETHPKPLAALAWSQIQLLSISGFLPQFASCVVTGSEVREAEPYVSPSAGGYVVAEAAAQFADRFRSRPEVLIGLSRLSECDEPPPNLKFAQLAIIHLSAFWKYVIEGHLPANDAMIGDLREAIRNTD